MRSLAAAILVLVWTSVPIGTVAAKLLVKHCHCPGHKLPNGPAYAPCSSDEVNVAKASPVDVPQPAALWVTRAPAQEYTDTYPPAKPGPDAGPATPPPKV